MTYPMEIFINGELSFKLDTEDAGGDLAAIKALMTMRTAKRQNRPLTNVELYGADLGPGDVVYADAYGNTLTLRGDKMIQRCTATPVFSAPHGKPRVEKSLQLADGPCTFKKGDNDPCPACPQSISALHRCALLQDELASSEETLRPEGGGQD